MAHPRVYETVVIFGGKLDEATIEAELNKLKAQLEEMGATIDAIDSWGRRSLEYEIKHQREGVYVIFTYTFSGEGAAMRKFEHSLQINENVIRSLTVHREDLSRKRFRPKKEKPAKPKKPRPAPKPLESMFEEEPIEEIADETAEV